MNKAFKTLGMNEHLHGRRLTTARWPFRRASSPRPTSAKTSTRSPTRTCRRPPRHRQRARRCWSRAREGGGTLIAVYGDKITPEECQQALDFMSLERDEGDDRGGAARRARRQCTSTDTCPTRTATWRRFGGRPGRSFSRCSSTGPTWLEWALFQPDDGRHGAGELERFPADGRRAGHEPAADAGAMSNERPRRLTLTTAASVGFNAAGVAYASGSPRRDSGRRARQASRLRRRSRRQRCRSRARPRLDPRLRASVSRRSSSLPNSRLIASSPTRMPLRTSSTTSVFCTSSATFVALVLSSFACVALGGLGHRRRELLSEPLHAGRDLTLQLLALFALPRRLGGGGQLRAHLRELVRDAALASASLAPRRLSSFIGLFEPWVPRSSCPPCVSLAVTARTPPNYLKSILHYAAAAGKFHPDCDSTSSGTHRRLAAAVCASRRLRSCACIGSGSARSLRFVPFRCIIA